MLSRVADNLYWMSRYLERAEHTARLLDVHLNLMLEIAGGAMEQQRRQRLLESLHLPLETAEADVVRQLTFAAEHPTSIFATIRDARDNAQYAREQISSEMWMQINKLYLYVNEAEDSGIWLTAPHDFYLAVREGSHLFQGITDGTMNHNQGWQFIQIGRYIERSLGLLHLLDAHFRGVPLVLEKTINTDDYFDRVVTLKSVTAFEAYCKVYNPTPQPAWMVEFLLFNAEFPRSLRFCVEMLLAALAALADATGRSKNTRLYRIAGRLQSKLAFDEVADVQHLHRYIESIRQQFYQIHDTLYETYITYPIESAL